MTLKFYTGEGTGRYSERKNVKIQLLLAFWVSWWWSSHLFYWIKWLNCWTVISWTLYILLHGYCTQFWALEKSMIKKESDRYAIPIKILFQSVYSCTREMTENINLMYSTLQCCCSIFVFQAWIQHTYINDLKA